VRAPDRQPLEHETAGYAARAEALCGACAALAVCVSLCGAWHPRLARELWRKGASDARAGPGGEAAIEYEGKKKQKAPVFARRA